MTESAERFEHDILEGMEFSIRIQHAGDDGEPEYMDINVTGVHRDADGNLQGHALAVDDHAMTSESDVVRVPSRLVLVEGGPAVVEAEEDHKEDEPHKPLISKRLAAAIGATVVVGFAIAVPFIARHKKS